MSNTVSVVGTRGTRLDLRIRRGASLVPVVVTLKRRSTGAAFDLTGYTPRARCMTREDPGVGKAMTAALEGAAALGKVRIGMTAAVSATLPGGAHVTSPPKVCDWVFELVDGAGAVTPVFYGQMEVGADVADGS